LELLPLKNRSFSAALASGLFLAATTLGLTACAKKIYYYPEYNYSGRPTPPSGLLQRVMASYTANGSSGGLEIIDGYRDLRGNVQNTIKSYFISGFSEAEPMSIINYPEQTEGFVFSSNDGALNNINYSKESGVGSVATFGAASPSAAATTNGIFFAGAIEQSGVLDVIANGVSYGLYLPNVNKVVIDPGSSTILAMVRNSNSLYRVVRLPTSTNPLPPPGAIDCEPLILPVYCVVPVAGNYDRPTNVSFSLDGTTAYVLNSGPEDGGNTASVSFLKMAALNINLLPTVNPLSVGAPSPLMSLPVPNPIPVPGGVTAALSDGTNLYLSGQQLQTSGVYAGLLAGNLSLLNLSTYTVGTPISISDGMHTKMLFADNATLWIGSSQCANGVRGAKAAAGITTQDANYNCLTRYVLPATGGAAANPILPNWVPNMIYNAGSQVTDGANIEVALVAGTSGKTTPAWTSTTTTDGGITWRNIGTVTAAQVIPAVAPNLPGTSNTALAVLYPNTNQNQYYYGSLTGICWVQTYGKVYTADGGQVHAFNTADGSERDNYYITVQGTVYDVAYMDALTNFAN
jgi:hypothetical protein